jgi:hypothetical protein
MPNEFRQKMDFDPFQIRLLGNYIYALRDPRDNKIFYVGQGKGNRVFDHLKDAQSTIDAATLFSQISSKLLRIIDIWNNDEEVEILFIAHGLPEESKELIDKLESSVYDALSVSQNGATSNENTPPGSSFLTMENLEFYSADFVNPSRPISAVFIFPIHNTSGSRESYYEATRKYWKIGSQYRSIENAFAVGVEEGYSHAAFRIKDWVFEEGRKKWIFNEDPNQYPDILDELLRKNWKNILRPALGHFQRGAHIVAEFDGKGRFRIIKGSADKATWHDCV